MKITKAKNSNSKVDSKLVWNKEGSIVWAMLPEGEKVKFTEYPDWVNPTLRKIPYRLTYEGNKLVFLSPIQGIFKARFVEFQHKDDQPLQPEPRNGTGQYGPWVQYQFRASLRLTDKDMNGMPVTLFLVYGTDKRDYIANVGGKAFLAESSGNNEAKAFLLLKEFLEATGASEPDYDFKDNLLPEFEKVAKKNNREFSIIYEDGYVKKIVPSDEEFAEDEEEAEFIEDDADELEGFDTPDDKDTQA